MFNHLFNKIPFISILPLLGLLKYGAVAHLIKAHILATYLLLLAAALVTLRSLALTRSTLALLATLTLYFYSDVIVGLHPSLAAPLFLSY